MRRSARDLAAQVNPATSWSYDRIRQDAQQGWATDGGSASAPLPYVPGALPAESEVPSPRWGWGMDPAMDVADTAIDLLGQLAGTVPR